MDQVSTTSGDITSLKYNSVEYQDSSKYTHIGSGLGSATVTSKVSGNYATITIATSTLVSPRYLPFLVLSPNLCLIPPDPILRRCKRSKCDLYWHIYYR